MARVAGILAGLPLLVAILLNLFGFQGSRRRGDRDPALRTGLSIAGGGATTAASRLPLMPLSYSVDHANRLAHLTGHGAINTSEVLAMQDRQAAEGAWTYRTLVDFSGAAWVPTSDEVRGFISHVRGLSAAHGRRGPLAMVARADSALFGMFRMYSILGEQADAVIEIFPSVQSAEHWLGSS